MSIAFCLHFVFLTMNNSRLRQDKHKMRAPTWVSFKTRLLSNPWKKVRKCKSIAAGQNEEDYSWITCVLIHGWRI